MTPQLQLHQPQPPLGSSEPQEDPQVAAARAVCSSLPGLAEQQIEVCLQHPNTIRSVSDGARRGIQECQYQFRNERWNCTTRNDEQSVFGYILERGKFHAYSVAYPGILFEGGSTNSVEDRGQRERGSGGGSPLVRGSGGSCNLLQEISFHIVKFS